ncbi:MAG: thiol peroxidase [Woeseia sp.]
MGKVARDPLAGRRREKAGLMARVLYNGTRYRTIGDLPPIGSKAPDMSLVNGELQDVTLADWFGKRKVLNILPSIDRDDCAKSVLAFDRLARDAVNVAMLTISCDLPYAHIRFREAHGLQRIAGLSSLRHAGFGENYGVQVVEGPLEGMFSRAVLVLDENDTVVYGEQIEDANAEPDYGAVCEALGIDCDVLDLQG